jgi:hypothetical protein
MSVDQLMEWVVRGDLLQCQFVHHKCHMVWLSGIDPRPVLWGAVVQPVWHDVSDTAWVISHWLLTTETPVDSHVSTWWRLWWTRGPAFLKVLLIGQCRYHKRGSNYFSWYRFAEHRSWQDSSILSCSYVLDLEPEPSNSGNVILLLCARPLWSCEINPKKFVMMAKISNRECSDTKDNWTTTR